MNKVVHLIPYDGIGGVETAARSMVDVEVDQDQIDFQVDYIFQPAYSSSRRLATFNPLKLVSAAYRLILQKPDLLIISLWRSCIVGIIVKLFRPHLRMVLFLHSPDHVHWLDHVLTHFTAKLAYQVWADSKETLARRLGDSLTERGRVISFVTMYIPALAERPVKPVFIFWGRIHRQKGLDRALRIFSAVHAAYPTARFMIIGPDGGDLVRIQRLAKDTGLAASVSYLGGMDFSGIARQARFASFYLQTSLLEGVAMSVVEAMQLGLVPVVTPVGEIQNYCRHGDNALIVQAEEAVVDEILEVLGDNERYTALRKHAVATWDAKPLYAESVLEACTATLFEDLEN